MALCKQTGSDMERLDFKPRPGWQSLADSVGFTWHHDNGLPYWDEGAAYAFSLEQIENDIEAPTEELHEMCLDLVDEVVRSEELMEAVDIPAAMRDYVANSWHKKEPSLYGRFDFAYDGKGPAKMYEYNADTPTSIFETGVFQWLWLEEQMAAGVLPAHADQFNSLHEKLVARFAQLFPPVTHIHFSSDPDYVEDRQTVLFLEDIAVQADLKPRFVAIDQIGVTESGTFVDFEDRPITALFKLYPWEDMLRDPFAAHLAGSGVKMLEPAWKSILSNKAILPLLWQRHAGHPNLLETYFEHDPMASQLGRDYARKPFFSREGANVELVGGGISSGIQDGGYGKGRHILQALHPAPRFSGQYAIIGSWIVGNEAAGMSLREDDGPITRNTSRFVPHFID